VTLVTTSNLPPPPGVEVVAVETAEEMARAVDAILAKTDVLVMAAAVADFRPSQVSDTKLRRADGPPDITLVPNPDILASVVKRDPRPFVVGFAAETGGLESAIGKAAEKGVDLLVANDVTAPGSGFGTDTTQVMVVDS
jgi:phosphopantothenoylcysteine decarboxylase/phosphopantothenate--cysteine ligase